MKFGPLTEATALPNSVHVNSPAAAQDQPTHAESRDHLTKRLAESIEQ